MEPGVSGVHKKSPLGDGESRPHFIKYPSNSRECYIGLGAEIWLQNSIFIYWGYLALLIADVAFQRNISQLWGVLFSTHMVQVRALHEILNWIKNLF